MYSLIEERKLKTSKGITLISLVVTIIILLILAGISIGMLSGDNGILGQAGNAKTQTDIAEEKEIIDLAVVHAMGKSKYGDIDETYFTSELEKNNATVTKSGSKYKVSFSSGRQYSVDQDGNVKEKNPNAMEISELNENASTYFGWDVINYAETLPEDLQDTKWQLFYAGKLDETDENEEERIYIISKGYIKYDLLPSKDGLKTIKQINSNYATTFDNSTPSGIMTKYTGSADIKETKLKKLNRKYFEFLNNNQSINPNMKAIAYMMDTEAWGSFATSKKNYAEYAIGGPTIELLFVAYNKYTNKDLSEKFETQVKSNYGYKISNDGGNNYEYYYYNIIDNPYKCVSMNNTNAYWIASPSGENQKCLMVVESSGNVHRRNYIATNIGFCPLVLLDSNYTLEKTKDSNGNDAFKIVEQ